MEKVPTGAAAAPIGESGLAFGGTPAPNAARLRQSKAAKLMSQDGHGTVDAEYGTHVDVAPEHDLLTGCHGLPDEFGFDHFGVQNLGVDFGQLARLFGRRQAEAVAVL